MKKLFSIILVVVMLVSAVTVIEVGAINHAEDKDFLFLDDFDAKHGIYEYTDSVDYYYDELYYHHVDENEPESEIDWVIIYALFEPVPMEEVKIVADRLVYTSAIGDPFILHYGLYDVALNDFIAIEEVDVTKYDGFEKGLEEAKVGNPFGDADYDGKLTIMDATYIQRVVALLCAFGSHDYYEGYGYLSDINRDGKRTILDATAIQMKLAKTEDTATTE